MGRGWKVNVSACVRVGVIAGAGDGPALVCVWMLLPI